MATPKIGLKHPKAVSKIAEMAPGTQFRPLIVDQFGKKNKTQKVVVCSGKVFFDIQGKLSAQEDKLSHKVAVLRAEELAPFPIISIEE